LPSISQNENLYVLDGHGSANTGGQHIVAFHPGASNVVTLPAGLVSQDHQRLYTAIPHKTNTQITVTDTKSGTSLRNFTIPGSYSTAEQNYTQSVLSADGRWLALKQFGGTEAKSTFVVIDTTAAKIVKTLQLQGSFDLDAISPNGSRLYLLERLHDTTGHYYVRRYDVDKGQLFPTIIADKSEINDPRMIGSALTRQMATDGTRAYTLYTDTRSNIAFVHVLPMTSDLNLARCIDLPTGKSTDLLHYYTLTLLADDSTLYATNAALGVMVVINVDDKDAVSDDIRTTVHFSPANAQVSYTERMRLLYNGAALSPDQSTLYVIGMRGIVAINIADAKIQQSYESQQTFTGIALSRDGQTLYAVSPNTGLMLINVRSGQAQKVAQSPAHAPWGIEWISNT
jgi:DNA-binding beta-propeller fold protein YncE